MEKEIVEKFMISKEDMEKCFCSKKEISYEELVKYYKIKGKIHIGFNAIFNATPKKKYKKRSETR